MDGAAGHRAHDVGARHHRRQERRLRVAAVKLAECLVEQRTGHVAGHGEVYRPRQFSTQVADQEGEAVDTIGDFAGFPVEHLASRRQRKAGWTSNGQLALEPLFQLLEGGADGRLPASQDLGGLGNAVLLGHDDEHVQQVPVDLSGQSRDLRC